MPYTSTIPMEQLDLWLREQKPLKFVKEQLELNGMPVELQDEMYQQYRKMRTAKRQWRGFVCLGIGAFLGFFSCFLTLIEAFPSLNSLILYGITGIGVCIIFNGLYNIFED